MKTNQKLFFLFLAGLVFRLILSPFGTHQLDFNTYLAWSNRLVEHGFFNFYQIWSDYLPGYLYFLWVLGKLKLLLPFLPPITLYKLPAILADILSSWLIFKLIKKKRLAFLAATVYIFNPVTWANSTLWGQTDSFTALAALLWFYGLKSRRFTLSALALGLGTTIKPTLAILAPLSLLYPIPITYPLTTALTFAATFLPFTPINHLPQFIFERLQATTSQYPYTTVHAFNLWQLLEGSWQPDASTFLHLSKQLWGWLLFASASAIALIRLRTKPIKLTAAIFLSAFLFLTRIHERHLLPVFPFLALSQSWPVYIWYSLAYLLNLKFSFQAVTSLYQSQFLSLTATKIVSALNLLGLLWFISAKSFPKTSFPKLKSSSRPLKHSQLILLAVLAFALITRIIRLGIPANFYFDEVYHAFTAQEMLKGAPQAWEWWNPNPQGVAYEWTHPPLAKEFMLVSMALLGQIAFAWRLPAVLLSVGTIYLIYLLAQHFFQNHRISLLAAFIFSLDGLNFVQSRIAMNDTYLLFFLLLALFLFLKKKYLSSSLAFGLALASKWSAIYLLPILAIAYFFQEKISLKKILVLTIIYLTLPAAVYLLAYLPFFTSGHSWTQFIQLQQQMYWYHSQLSATHAYQSQAWSWPLNLRPVWYYVDYKEATIANIYALGHPLIFWSGFLAVIYTALQLITRKISLRSSHFLLLSFYFLLFAPWLFSPRIMFLYHYLPATPFMIILLAWTLTRFPKKFVWPFLTFSFALFIFFYPHWTAIPIPKTWANIFFWLSSWK